MSAPGPRRRVLIVDDHAGFREGLHALLSVESDLEVVGEATDGHAGIEKAGRLRPDVVVMDVSMPGVDGIEATRAIHARWPQIRIVGVSFRMGPAESRPMREAGAAANVSKSDPHAELLAAIRG